MKNSYLHLEGLYNQTDYKNKASRHTNWYQTLRGQLPQAWPFQRGSPSSKKWKRKSFFDFPKFQETLWIKFIQ